MGNLSASPIVERIVDDVDQFHIVRSQDVKPILKAISEVGDIAVKSRLNSNQQYIGSVPNIMAVAWAKEWGVRLYSKEWLKKTRRRLDDSEFSKLRVRYK